MTEQETVRVGREVSPVAMDLVEIVVRMAQLERELTPQRKRQLVEAVTTRLERAAAASAAEAQRLRDEVADLQVLVAQLEEALGQCASAPPASEPTLPLSEAADRDSPAKGKRAK